MMVDFPRYDNYKSSGTDLLGEIPSHWRVQRLKHITQIRLSNVDKHTKANEIPVRLCNYTDVYYKDFITDDIEFMQATATEDQIDDFALEQDDVLITKDSESPDDIAVPAYVPRSLKGVICGYHLAHIRPLNINGSYLFRSFQAREIARQFEVSANGITRYGISKNVIGNALFLLPPADEQERIARFLDEKTAVIDDAIAKKWRLLELLQEQKAILINQAVTKGLNPNAPMKESGVEWIGRIPAHWEIKRVKHIFQLVIDPAPNNNNFELLSIYTDIGVRPRKELEERGNRATTTDGYWRVKKGDFIVNKLLAWMGAIGLSDYDGVTSPAYDILRPRIPISGDYYHALFRISIFSSELKKHSRGIMEMRLRLYFDKFGVVLVPYPPPEEQSEIAQRLREIDSEFSNCERAIYREIELLNEYKMILIAEAVTGKIKI